MKRKNFLSLIFAGSAASIVPFQGKEFVRVSSGKTIRQFLRELISDKRLSARIEKQLISQYLDCPVPEHPDALVTRANVAAVLYCAHRESDSADLACAMFRYLHWGTNAREFDKPTKWMLEELKKLETVQDVTT